ncbi:hypothetical protein BpHYR1_042901 [Brachionus plicatilis]|uniref:Uncharacterized protein n=1 Tax=Brachionus plicatilis TaxID=10195 RepID=A0A3M7T526_BRAPC|nr:hypothetical protein BpHYR1_042901 [Brachionus plicatilis]
MANHQNKYSLPKKSEYRHNFLPFDYYDFWITAKENENLRFKNKIRDYLHTPFDWDEDQEYYIEQASKTDLANQGTQTSERPNRHDQLKLQSKSESCLEKPTRVNKKMSKKIEPKRGTKSASVQVNTHKAFRPKRSNKQPQTKLKPDSNLVKSKKFTSSLSSMAVQTPVEWRLRDYKNTRPTSKIQRSSSLVNFQPKRPPFANYGWASRTKDLCVKPTHNALANKVLADHFNDHDAILELTLHKLKKDAGFVANEYSAVESQVANKFNNNRSDSRVWNSEYDENFADYSKSALRKELYMQINPNRLTKSSLISNIQNPLNRGPNMAKKIYYLD